MPSLMRLEPEAKAVVHAMDQAAHPRPQLEDSSQCTAGPYSGTHPKVFGVRRPHSAPRATLPSRGEDTRYHHQWQRFDG